VEQLLYIYVPIKFLLDFILTYQDDPDKDAATDDKKAQRRRKREEFLSNCEAKGLQFELQDCSVCHH